LTERGDRESESVTERLREVDRESERGCQRERVTEREKGG